MTRVSEGPPETPQALQDLIGREPALALYFTAPECAVCHALLPKLSALFAERFPELRLVRIDCASHPALCAGQAVFNVPGLLVFLQGKLWLQYARNLSLQELASKLRRPYDMLFG